MFNQAALIDEVENLRRFALRLTGNMSDAEDLVQSTVLRALEKKHLFTEGTNLIGWASKIMYNIFVSQYRRKTKFETQYDPESYIERESVKPSQESVTDLATVRRAMKSLSNDHRKILILVCIKGMRYEEVSELLQIPVGTVRSRLSRAREQLQTVMNAPRRIKSTPPIPQEHAYLPSHIVAQASASA